MDRPTSSVHEWLRTIAILLTPVVVAYVGARFAAASSEKATNARFIEIATQILQTAPTDSTRPLRAWAVDLIDHYSEVKLGPKLKQLLGDSLRLAGLGVEWTTSKGRIDAGGVLTFTGPGRYVVRACVAGTTICDTSVIEFPAADSGKQHK